MQSAATREWDFDRQGVHAGHYFTENYEAAKQDFAVRAGLVESQRLFSEGCGGWISEKSKKNLSQSYGRWIVGFHEPMTSAFFALKKG